MQAVTLEHPVIEKKKTETGRWTVETWKACRSLVNKFLVRIRGKCPKNEEFSYRVSD